MVCVESVSVFSQSKCYICGSLTVMHCEGHCVVFLNVNFWFVFKCDYILSKLTLTEHDASTLSHFKTDIPQKRVCPGI